MGSSNSRSNEGSQRRFLVGSLNKKPDVEQKFFGVSQLVDLNISSQGKEKHENGIKEVIPCGSQEQDILECRNGGTILFKPLSLKKPIYASETFVAWKAHYDIEQMQMKLMRKKTDIYLVAIGNFPSFITDFRLILSNEPYSLFDILKRFLEIFYQNMPVIWLSSINPEEKNWNITTRNHKVTGKKQYLVSDFYPQLKKWKPKNTYGILGLTWTDLYPKESLNFVLGEASKRHKSGVISFGRFEPKAFDEEKSRDVEEINHEILWKLLKVSSHELGHLFGLSHCDFFLCGMNGSSSVEEAMSQPLFFCPICIRKVQHACKFNIVQRYRDLQRFFDDLNEAMPCDRFRHCKEWLDNCLHFLIDDEE